MKISVVIPVYRSASSLPLLMARLAPVLDAISPGAEVVLVDDGSEDNTWEVVEKLHAEYPGRIMAVQLTRNFGQHNATMCGFRHAQGQIIVTMDDDLQHAPEELPRLLDCLRQEGHDVVYGQYRIKRHNVLRQLVTAPILYYYRKVFSLPHPATSYRVARREAIGNILYDHSSFCVIDALLAATTRRFGYVAIDQEPRRLGRSTHSFAKLVQLAFNFFTNASLLPLRMLVWLSLAVLGVAGLAAALSSASLDFLRWTPAVVLAVAAVQLLAVALLGEYVGRLHLNVNRRPQYVVRQVLAPDGETRWQTKESGERVLGLFN